jgi:Mg2+/Co2+ transporter CorB
MRIPSIAKSRLKPRIKSRMQAVALLPPPETSGAAKAAAHAAHPAAAAGSASAVATITFALVFLGVIAAFALGALPSEALTFGGNVEAGVVLLFVPLCALIFAVLVEVIRSALTSSFGPRRPQSEGQVLNWRPGHGEG